MESAAGSVAFLIEKSIAAQDIILRFRASQIALSVRPEAVERITLPAFLPTMLPERAPVFPRPVERSQPRAGTHSPEREPRNLLKFRPLKPR